MSPSCRCWSPSFAGDQAPGRHGKAGDGSQGCESQLTGEAESQQLSFLSTAVTCGLEQCEGRCTASVGSARGWELVLLPRNSWHARVAALECSFGMVLYHQGVGISENLLQISLPLSVSIVGMCCAQTSNLWDYKAEWKMDTSLLQVQVFLSALGYQAMKLSPPASEYFLV